MHKLRRKSISIGIGGSFKSESHSDLFLLRIPSKLFLLPPRFFEESSDEHEY